MNFSQDPATEALDRLKALLDDDAPFEPDVFSRLVHALVRRAGPEGERVFGERLVRERDPARGLALVEASPGALGVRVVVYLRHVADRWARDDARMAAAAVILGRLGTPEAHDVLCRVAARGDLGAREAVEAARARVEGAHPTRYRLLPRLRLLADDEAAAGGLEEELLEAADNELVTLLMDSWDGLGAGARKVVLAVMERRGDSLAGHVIQSEIEVAPEGELLTPLCRALRGILDRHPQSAQGFESLWQSVWAQGPADRDVALTAALALTATPEPERVELYREFLASPDEPVRHCGLRALAAVPDPSAREDVLRSLESASEEEMAGALQALVAMGDERTLEQWSRTSDPSQRRGVARVCLRVLRPDLWSKLASDSDESVSQAAFDAWRGSSEAGALTSRHVVPLLKGAPAEHVFQRACRVLASIGDKDAVPVLAKCLKQPGAVRVPALRTLKALRLRQVYQWSSLATATQTSILRAMEDLSDVEALSLLSTLAVDLPPPVREQLRIMLRTADGQQRRLDPEDDRVQEVAEIVYGHLVEKIEAMARREFAGAEIRRLIDSRPSRPDLMTQAVRRVAGLWCKPDLAFEESLVRQVEGFLSTVSGDRTSPQGARREAIAALGTRGGADVMVSVLALRNHPLEEIAEAATAAVDAFARRNPGADLARLRSGQDERARLVLVADDEPEIRSLYQSFLGLNGVATVGAADGEEVLRVLEGKGVGLVVLDLDMPRRDGLDVLAEIRKRPVRPPVIVVTGRTDQRTVLSAHSLGAAAFLRKPVDLLDLFDRVRQTAPWEIPLATVSVEALSPSLRSRAARVSGGGSSDSAA